MLYNLTHPQKRILQLEQMYPDTSAANIMGNAIFDVSIDFKLFEEAINLAIKNCDALRTQLTENEKGEILQQIYSYEWVNIEHLDFKDKEEEFNHWKLNEANKPFKLLHSKLSKIWMYTSPKGENGIIIKLHHIISDAWTIICVLNIIKSFYQKLSNGEAIEERLYSHIKFKETENKYLNSNRCIKDRQFWIDKFKDFETTTAIKQRNSNMSIAAKRYCKVVTGEQYLNIMGFCKKHQVTPYAFMFSCLQLLLWIYTDNADVTLGTVLLNRSTKEEKSTPGMLISTLAVRNKINKDISFVEYTHKVSAALFDIMRHQKYPYDKLLEELRDDFGITQELYDVSISYQNISVDSEEKFKIESEWMFNNNSFDMLTVHINDRDNRNEFFIDYDYQIEQLCEYEVEEFHNYYFNVINWCIENEDKAVSKVTCLTDSQKKEILNAARGSTNRIEDNTIIDAFEKVVQRFWDRRAIYAGDLTYTYRQINERANKIANCLHQKGVVKGDNIPIIMNCSVDFVVSALACMKCGAAYVPVDSGYPKERIDYIIKHCNGKLILCNSDIIEIQQRNYEVINTLKYDFEKYSTESPAIKLTGSDIIYMIYTSGTTGNPKGVVLSHRSVANYIFWAIKAYVENGKGNMPLFTSISFDLTVTSLFVPLLSGSSVIVYGEGNPNEILELIMKDGRSNIVKLTPAHLSMVNEMNCTNGQIYGMVLGGEELKGKVAFDTYTKFNGNVKIYNEYGPTEATVGCMIYQYQPKDDISKGVLIGKAINNSAIYILSKEQELRPVGMVGELCIAGEGLAVGYYKESAMTEARFIKNPLIDGERIYRTGDLAILTKSGDIQYIGRADEQVKIRGFRIELSEIQNTAMSINGIINAAVVLVGNESLALYYITESSVDKDVIRQYLKERLPIYMLPTYYVELDKMPLTANGKTNIRALPKVSEKDMIKSQFLGAENELEQQLIDIWETVLKVDKIGVNDDFYDLGGHSLKAIEISNAIKVKLKINAGVSDIFSHTTVRALSTHLEKMSNNCLPAIKDSYSESEKNKLTSNEMRLYSIWQLDKTSLAYNMPAIFKIDGDVDAKRLRNCFVLLLQQNETLRTNYILANGQPEISILDRDKIEERFELESFLADEKPIDDIVCELRKPFDLERDLLIRAWLGYTANKPNLLFVDIHHIASDGVSNGIYMKQLEAFYKGTASSKGKHTYRDYAAWTGKLAESEKLVNSGRDFWKSIYSKEIEPLNLPAHYQNKIDSINESDACEIILENAVLNEVRRIVRESKITLFTFMLGSFAMLLSKYSGNEDLVIGIPYLGRDIKEFEEVPGFFATTLPIRLQPLRKMTGDKYFIQTKDILNQCYSNSFIPFEEIVKVAGAERVGNENVMFNVVFGMFSEVQTDIPLGQGCALNQIEKDYSVEKFNMTLQIFEQEDRLRCRLSFKSGLYSCNGMRNLLNHYGKVISNICNNFYGEIKNIDVYTVEERKQLALRYQEITAKANESGNTIASIFEGISEEYCDKEAIFFGDGYLTYKQLNKKVNKLANHLRKLGIGRNDIVAIMLDKSIEMVVAIMAVIKAGAAYLPIDTDNPEQRVSFITEDSGAKKVISSAEYMKYFEGSKYLDIYDESNYVESDENPNNINVPEDIAYVIYTSGTTGRPKGALMMHKNAIAIAFEKDIVNMSANDRVLQLCNYAFDVSVGEIMCSLLNGATLYVVEKDLIFNINNLIKYIVEKEITFIFTTTAIFNLIVDTNVEALKGIRRISVGGEKASVRHMNRAFEAIGGDKVINAYGPTETTVLSTGFLINEPIDENKYGRVPIGKSVSYLYTYIMNDDMELLPEGAVGELVIGGLGVGKGYLNNQEMTAKRFIKNPFNEAEVMYRTGDLVRILPNGDIDFLDRIDGQVKIRGYRVETSEIEKHIKQYGNIIEAVVITDTDKNSNVTELIAYVLADSLVDINELRKHLYEVMPSYMVPSYISQVDYIPLTSNGKIDKRKLVKPKKKEKVLSYELENEIQEKFAEVWKQVLGINSISIDEDFFELGGDSIKAIQIVAKLQKLGLEIDVKTVMSVHTIREQSVFTKQTIINKHEQMEVVSGYVINTPIICQFMEEYDDIFSHFNQAIVITNEERWNEELLTKALDKVCTHHDMLRGVWKENCLNIRDEGAVGYTFDIAEINGTTYENKEALEDMCAEYQKSFDIVNGPLMKVVLFRCSDCDNLLFIVHHLVIDGISWRILLEDFDALYSAALSGEELELQFKTTSYQKWASELKLFADSDKLKKAYLYWNEILKDRAYYDEKNIYAKDRLLKDLSYENIVLDCDRTSLLLHETGNAFHCSTSDILLAALCKAYKEIFYEHSLMVNMENHGREAFEANLNIVRTIGWFTAVYPQLLEFSRCDSLDDYIISVKDALRKVPNKGFEYGVLKYLSNNEKYDTSEWKPYCQVGFNYLGEFDNVNGNIKTADIEIREAFSPMMHQNVKLELNGIVKNNKLELSFSYLSAELSTELMKHFVKRYCTVLNEMIDYCSVKEDTTYTVTDFSDESLTADELSELMDMFG